MSITRILARVFLVLGCLLLLIAFLTGCERDPETPTSPAPTTTTIPAPTARALMQPTGSFLFNNCTVPPTSTCIFNGTLVNNGTGCAIRIEGTLRLFDITGLQLGGVYRFSLFSQQIVQPGERVGYVANFVPITQALATTTYLVDPQWIDTACR